MIGLYATWKASMILDINACNFFSVRYINIKIQIYLYFNLIDVAIEKNVIQFFDPLKIYKYFVGQIRVIYHTDSSHVH